MHFKKIGLCSINFLFNNQCSEKIDNYENLLSQYMVLIKINEKSEVSSQLILTSITNCSNIIIFQVDHSVSMLNNSTED